MAKKWWAWGLSCCVACVVEQPARLGAPPARPVEGSRPAGAPLREAASMPPAEAPGTAPVAPTPAASEAPNVELPVAMTMPDAPPTPPPGEAPPGDAPPGDAPPDDAPSGDAPAGELPSGEAPSGELPPGDSAPANAPAADPPSEDTPLAPAPEGPDNAAPPPEMPAGRAPPDALADAPLVTVSLTFDDSWAPQRDAAAILEAHGLRGTFYVNSPRLHRASARPTEQIYLSIADVLGMQASGHDVGGHTLSHASLTDLPEAERVHELLGDRAQLVRLGVQARSFAYPFGHVEDDPDRSLGRRVLEIARGSGYTSARDTNGFSLDRCDRGPESLPPADAFIVRSVRSVNEPPDGAELRDPPDTAATLLGWADRAASCGGGWLPLVFHHLREDCSAPDAPVGYCFDFAELDRLASELDAGRRCPPGAPGQCYRFQVATVSDAIGVRALAPAPEVPGVGNPSLERTYESGETECIRRTGASATATFSRSTLARSGVASERLAIAAPFVASAEIGLERDFGECAVFATPGRTYGLSLYYRADPQLAAPQLRPATYRLTSAYQWVPWATGNSFTAQSPGAWSRLTFTTAPVPEGTLAISFGVRQESAGAINVDDFDATPL